MGWFSDFSDEIQKENQGLKIYQTRVFWEALSVVVLAVRGLAECLEYFPMTIMQPVQRWGLELSAAWTPYFRWVPGVQGVTDAVLARWAFGWVYQLPVILAFILINYILVTIFTRQRPNFLKVAMAVGIAIIPYKTWWYSASGEAVWVITPQIIHLGMPGASYLVPPVQTIEAFWRTYIMTGIVFFMWSIALMYGLHRYLFNIKRWQGYMLNLPWIFYCTYVISGIWGKNVMFSISTITVSMSVMVIIAWAILIGGKKILVGMGKQRFVDTYGGKIAGWTCILLASCYYEFNFRQRDKTNIENQLMVLGGHYKTVGLTINRMQDLQEDGKIAIDKNVKLNDEGFQEKLVNTPEKKWTYGDVVRSMLLEEYEKDKNVRLTKEEAETLVKWDEKKWLPFDSMDPEIGRLIRFIAQSKEGGAA